MTYECRIHTDDVYIAAGPVYNNNQQTSIEASDYCDLTY